MFSRRLAEAIRICGIKKSALARKIGVTPGTLSRYLNGSIVPDQPVKLLLAQELGVTVEYLIVDSSKSAPLADPPVMHESKGAYIPETVSLVGLNEDERRTVLRIVDALRSGQADVQQHLIGQLKIIELVVQSRRKQPHLKEGHGQ